MAADKSCKAACWELMGIETMGDVSGAETRPDCAASEAIPGRMNSPAI
jgi:hypothetical protein